MIKSSCVDKGLLKAYIVGFIYEETSTFWKQLHDSGSDLSCSAYSSRFKRQNLDLKRFQISNLLPVYIRLMFFPRMLGNSKFIISKLISLAKLATSEIFL